MDVRLPQDPLGFELIACVATSCSKQPHAEGQKVRRAYSWVDRAVKALVSWEGRCCYKCVTDMLNPQQKAPGMLLLLLQRSAYWINTDRLSAVSGVARPLY